MTEDNMVDHKDKLDVLKFVTKIHRELHEKRQKYEWRILYTTITFYVLTVVSFWSEKISLNKISIYYSYKIIIIWSLLLTIAIISILFLRRIHQANCINKTAAERMENVMHDFINKSQLRTFSFPSKEDIRKTYWAFWWQAFIILIFSITSALLLTLLTISKSTP